MFLLAFGAFVSVVFTALVLVPAGLTSIVQANTPAQTVDDRTIRQACGASVLGTLVPLAACAWWNPPTLLLLLVPIMLGGLAGGKVFTRGRSAPGIVAVACLAFALVSFVVLAWFVFVFILLDALVEPLGNGCSVIAACGLAGGLVLLLAAYIVRPVVGVLVGLLLAGFWICAQASPDGGTMIASALFTANLGGGRPAHIDQSKVIKGEICNLGVDARPVLVFEPNGCERKTALTRLHTLRGLGSLERKRILAVWRATAEAEIGGSHRP